MSIAPFQAAVRLGPNLFVEGQLLVAASGCQCDVRRCRIAQFATEERDIASSIGRFLTVRKLRKPMETIALANGTGPVSKLLGWALMERGLRFAVKAELFPLHADCIQDNKFNAFNLGVTRHLDCLGIARRGD